MKLPTKLTCALTIIVALFLTVHAHPGMTDADGGHMDHGTGQYHYHHGQSAHQHFDIDSNGSLDCPLTFDGSPDNSQSPAIGFAAASCIGIAVTAGVLSKSKEKERPPRCANIEAVYVETLHALP